jgi:hypothetical protein
MIDSDARSLIIASLLRLLQVLDIPDEGDRVAVSGGPASVLLIELVIEDEILLPFGVKNPALVRVGCAFIGGYGYDFGEFLVGDVV